MKPRRTLPTLDLNPPPWRRAVREVVRRLVVWWAQHRRRCVVDEERGYRASGRVNGYELGPDYRVNCRTQRRQLRAIVVEWSR